MIQLRTYAAQCFWVTLLTLIPFGLGACGGHGSDHSSPKSTAKTMMQAMYNGDVHTARECVIDGIGQSEAVNGETEVMHSMKLTVDAINDRFGKSPGMSPSETAMSPFGFFESCVETIQGDSATLSFEQGKKSFKLFRIDGKWKIDLAATIGMNDPRRISYMSHILKAMSDGEMQVKAELDAGSFSDSNAAASALLAQMKQSAVDEQQRQILAAKEQAK